MDTNLLKEILNPHQNYEKINFNYKFIHKKLQNSKYQKKLLLLIYNKNKKNIFINKIFL